MILKNKIIKIILNNLLLDIINTKKRYLSTHVYLNNNYYYTRWVSV